MVEKVGLNLSRRHSGVLIRITYEIEEVGLDLLLSRHHAKEGQADELYNQSILIGRVLEQNWAEFWKKMRFCHVEVNTRGW
ncbi:hypothetical protein Nepgr_018542 [Nepenthes gracilis]|uniref:Uncharacterized protein n=1 Tax=Nepenthes gracilis TaxID=150966 RepID=A0AAD3SVA8_NEPGR|nr:hypothetical protein Nepgr_018542 [Nepenthes gracilis]